MQTPSTQPNHSQPSVASVNTDDFSVEEAASLIESGIKTLGQVVSALNIQVLGNADQLPRATEGNQGQIQVALVENLLKGPIRYNVKKLQTTQEALRNLQKNLSRLKR